MTTAVLAGLMYMGTEVYMDDIIIYGQTEKEYLANLEKVLARLVKFRLTVNPAKSKLGLQQVQYVGHVIDQEGITFDRARLEEFTTPQTKGELKSFLGLANVIRDHVEHHSEMVQPLGQYLLG